MNAILVAIKDKKEESFGPVYTSKNPAIANRDFTDACQKNDLWKSHPEDFCLCILAEYDQNTGKIKPLEEIKILTEAQNVVIKGE